MARPLRIQYPGAYYHVTCRGNSRQEIFLDIRDQNIFLEKLAQSLNIYNVNLLAYVCMPNHFHLLLITPKGNLSNFMRHFNISYTVAFNWTHQRVGHLYQGRYKAFLIDADSYLLEVSRYLHLNPIRKQAFNNYSAEQKWKALMNYQGSSLGGYLDPRKRKIFVAYTEILDFMGKKEREAIHRYQDFIQNGIIEETKNPLEIGKGTGIIGNESFVTDIKETYLEKDGSVREQPERRELNFALKPEGLIEQFCSKTGKSRKEICQKGINLPERSMLMELLYRHCNLSQAEIGRLVGGIDYCAVSLARKRLFQKLEQDPRLKKKYINLESRCICKE